MDVILRLLLGIPGFALAVVPHELAHAWAANKLGDPTARNQGRISLDPRRHFDPMGALFYVLSMVLAGVGFGWAKPVPINPWNFRDRRAGMALSSLAGPLSNLIQAVIWGTAIRLLAQSGYGYLLGGPLGLVLDLAFMINLVVFVFNMVPIPPLDGSRLLAWMLPEKGAQFLDRMEPYGMAIIFLALMLNGFRFLWPAMLALQRLILGIG